jgi:O-acetyl-ADP-ribose deacetylase (regulator of RNase III)
MAAKDERVRLIVGDIARFVGDAIVTSTNSALMGGGGVDGAVHRAAGPALLEALREIGYCPEGEARITPGFALPVRFVIHAVGPIYTGGQSGEAETLASAYLWSLRLAEENGVKTIAFPCISTAAIEYPRAEPCEVAVGTVVEWLAGHALPSVVAFCCHDPEDVEVYRERLGREPEELA